MCATVVGLILVVAVLGTTTIANEPAANAGGRSWGQLEIRPPRPGRTSWGAVRIGSHHEGCSHSAVVLDDHNESHQPSDPDCRHTIAASDARPGSDDDIAPGAQLGFRSLRTSHARADRRLDADLR